MQCLSTSLLQKLSWSAQKQDLHCNDTHVEASTEAQRASKATLNSIRFLPFFFPFFFFKNRTFQTYASPWDGNRWVGKIPLISCTSSSSSKKRNWEILDELYYLAAFWWYLCRHTSCIFLHHLWAFPLGSIR